MVLPTDRLKGKGHMLTMNDVCGLYCSRRMSMGNFCVSVERVLWTGWGSVADGIWGKGAYLFMDKPVLYCAIKASYLSTSKLHNVHLTKLSHSDQDCSEQSQGQMLAFTWAFTKHNVMHGVCSVMGLDSNEHWW